jgi:hypothetical protein
MKLTDVVRNTKIMLSLLKAYGYDTNCKKSSDNFVMKPYRYDKNLETYDDFHSMIMSIQLYPVACRTKPFLYSKPTIMLSGNYSGVDVMQILNADFEPIRTAKVLYFVINDNSNCVLIGVGRYDKVSGKRCITCRKYYRKRYFKPKAKYKNK